MSIIDTAIKDFQKDVSEVELQQESGLVTIFERNAKVLSLLSELTHKIVEECNFSSIQEQEHLYKGLF